MAGGHMKYRALSRKSSHRQALLRNLVTSTTWHKAKEAQRLAEKVVTLAKKNTEASRRRVEQIVYVRHCQAQGPARIANQARHHMR
jgi:ribosomal protein L17